jgi:DMSO/TMAO reductase YedYZ molybdopterin-dependent catalytic subunit
MYHGGDFSFAWPNSRILKGSTVLLSSRKLKSLKAQRGLSLLLLGLVVLAACTSKPVAQPTLQTPAGSPSPAPSPTACELPPAVVPTPPAETPGYTELDPATGLHVTGTVPEIDFDQWRLKVTGKVDNPLSLTYDELRCMRRIEVPCTLVCPGFFQDDATWAGTPIVDVLERAQVQSGAIGVRLISADQYSTYVSLDEARAKDAFLAYEWAGEPVPILHGFPVRAVFPELSGSRWAKWLIEIQVN